MFIQARYEPVRCDFQENGDFTDQCWDVVDVRYRRSESESWGYRCDEHAKYLDRSRVTVEPCGGIRGLPQ